MKPTILGIEAQGFLIRFLHLEASKGGTKVGRMKDPLYKDSYLGITPPTFILPVEAPDTLTLNLLSPNPLAAPSQRPWSLRQAAWQSRASPEGYFIRV